jgi:hypothetical protein
VGNSLGGLSSRFKGNTPPFDVKPQEKGGRGLSYLNWRNCTEQASHSMRHFHVCKAERHG